ncbi:TetR/AcrR family transcriptional regulator [Sphingobacterium chungjuense]|uniref:TetR/AcrR family transcriptional regulator n=1 Tax=Sphingobacterium chungjuense TaxID=2675553 RepID=UPI00140925A5|nr:TetR/AcrR family transcriptional regulator [Sphingobacterium chungjuense]
MNDQIIDKREAIFESTLKLINEKGFHGTPMSQIATNAKVAAGTIYHYFESKDVLITELFIYHRQKCIEYVFAETEGLTYQEKFFEIWNRVVDYYLSNTEVFWFDEQFYSSPYYELLEKSQKISFYGIDRLRSFLKDGIEQKVIKKLGFPTLMPLFIGSAKSYVRMETYGFYKTDQKEREDIIKIIWDGIKA